MNACVFLQVEATRRLIEQYKKENKTLITKNKGKLSREEEELELLLEQEREEAEERRRQARDEDRDAERERRHKKEALIDDLMFSDRSVDLQTPAFIPTVVDPKPSPIVHCVALILNYSTGLLLAIFRIAQLLRKLSTTLARY